MGPGATGLSAGAWGWQRPPLAGGRVQTCASRSISQRDGIWASVNWKGSVGPSPALLGQDSDGGVGSLGSWWPKASSPRWPALNTQNGTREDSDRVHAG